MGDAVGFLRFLAGRAWLALRDLRALHGVRRMAPDAVLERNVQVKRPDRLVIGRGVVIQRNSVLHCGGADWCGGEGGIEIGDGTCISPDCVLYGTGAVIRIGRNFDCGPGTRIFASRTRFEDAPPARRAEAEYVFGDVTIGDDVICFANVTISPGVSIGDGAVVAAGSVVLDDVPPETLVAGAPARVVRPRLAGREGAGAPDRP